MGVSSTRWATWPAALALGLALGGPAAAHDDEDDHDSEEGDDSEQEDDSEGDDHSGRAQGESSGYRDVDLVDGGRTQMEDKRDYRFALVPGISVIPPGFKARFQVLLSDRVALVVGGGYAGFGYSRSTEVDADGDGTNELETETRTDWTRYHALVGADFLPIGNGMHGFYIGPRALYRRGETSFSFFGTDAGTVRTLIVGRLLIGYSMVLDPGMYMKFGVGLGYREVAGSASASTGYGGSASSTSSLQHTTGTLEWNMGWAF